MEKKKALTFVIKKLAFGMAISSLFSFTVYAGVENAGWLRGGLLNDTHGYAYLRNQSTETRYCELFLREGSANPTTTIDFSLGVFLDNQDLYVDGTITKPHAWANGYVYNGQIPYSGVEWSDETQIK